jgi:quercetin dioxygenase-like cupin family protein
MNPVSSRDVSALRVLGTEVRFLCDARETGNAWSLMEVTLPLEAGPPPHRHAWDEAYYVTAGEVDFELDGQRFTARPGDFVYTAGGRVHGFRGASETAARVLIFDCPAHAATFFQRVDREVRELPRDLPRVFAIGRETGIEFAAPPS